jgi:hypothetical protein
MRPHPVDVDPSVRRPLLGGIGTTDQTSEGEVE